MTNSLKILCHKLYPPTLEDTHKQLKVSSLRIPDLKLGDSQHAHKPYPLAGACWQHVRGSGKLILLSAQ